MFLDLDRFKVVNDSLGHGAGDRLLTVVATRLRSAVRGSNLVARIGGDEFVVVADDSFDSTSVQALASRLHQKLSAPIEVGDHQVHVRASIGIATGDRRPEVLLANADAAMYRAKEQGRNRTEVFDLERASFSTDRIDLEADLRLALPRGELEVHYQPEVDLPDRRGARG